MKNSLLTGILMIIGVLIPRAEAQGIEFFKGSWEEALEEAALQKKIIFVDAYAVWCGPCKRMSRDVFPNEKVGAFYNAHFINLKMDMERGEGLQFRKKYPVTAFPTLFYISSDGEIVYTTKGARGVDQFLQLGQQVLGQYDESPKYAEEYEAGNRDPELIYDYIKALNEAGKSSLKISNDYLYELSSEEMKTDFNLRFILEAAVEADSRIFDLLVEFRSAIESLTSAEQVSERIQTACEATVSKAVEYESRTLLEEASSKMAAHVPEMAKAFAQRAEMQFAVAARNAAGFIQAAKSYSKLPEGKTAEELHATAQMLVKEFESDEDAVALAIKLAGKAAKADAASKRLIFLALLQDLGGQRKKAVKTLEKVLKSPDHATDERRARQLLESLQAE
jgi:thiol-disulfide isomerase/thioredoxin